MSDPRAEAQPVRARIITAGAAGDGRGDGGSGLSRVRSAAPGPGLVSLVQRIPDRRGKAARLVLLFQLCWSEGANKALAFQLSSSSDDVFK